MFHFLNMYTKYYANMFVLECTIGTSIEISI